MLLSEVLSSVRFSVVTDERVYRNQELLSVEDGVLTTKSLLKIPLSSVRFFFFRSSPSFRKRGRFGRFVNVKFTWRGREKTVEARILSEDSRWLLVEVGRVKFLLPRRA